jgi:DNA-binding response OmpR family regulator
LHAVNKADTMNEGANMEDTKKKILIVEDDHSLQAIYKDKFDQEGFAVFQAFNGQQGLTIAKDNPPDIILLDVMLPEGMNGFDLFEQLKRDDRLKVVPVIIFTNLDSEKNIAMTMGAADYIVKANTSIDELVAKVKQHLQKT